jgi:predicted Zn-dependent protease
MLSSRHLRMVLNSASPIPFLSTHPVNEERIAGVAAVAKELKTKQ